MLLPDPDVVADLLERYRSTPALRREIATADVLDGLERETPRPASHHGLNRRQQQRRSRSPIS